MSPLLQSLVLGGFVAGADAWSTDVGLRRGGYEMGIIKNRKVGAVIEGAAFAGADYLIQKRAPKLKWPYRITLGIAAGIVVHNNVKDRRRSQ